MIQKLLALALLSTTEAARLRGEYRAALLQKIRSATENSCANRGLDVLFVVDHSRSMSGNLAWKAGDTCGGNCKCAATNSCGKHNVVCAEKCGDYYWPQTQKHMRDFVTGVVDEFRGLEAEAGEGAEKTRFAWVGFNNMINGAIKEFSLEDGAGTAEEVSSLIQDSFQEYAPDTCMQEGLEYVHDEWAPGLAGNRPENPDVVIMITDGAYFCGNKGNCVKDGVVLDKRDPACAIDVAERLRNRGTTFFSVDILQWTCPFASSYKECLGVSDEGRAELMSELAGEKGCVPEGAPAHKFRKAKRSSGTVEICRHYTPILKFSGLAEKVTDIMDEVCEQVPIIEELEETSAPTTAEPTKTDAPTEPLSCNPTGRCANRYVCSAKNNKGKNRCVDWKSQCKSFGWGEVMYGREACPTEPATEAPTVEVTCNPTERCVGKWVCSGKNGKGKNRCVTKEAECESKGFGHVIYTPLSCSTDKPTESPTLPTDSPTTAPSAKPTKSPTKPTPPPTASLTVCVDGAAKWSPLGHSLITRGDARVIAHNIDGKIAIGGDLIDGTPQNHCPVKGFASIGGDYTGRWNFNGGVATNAEHPFNFDELVEISKVAKAGQSGSTKIVVQTSGGTFHRNSWGTGPPNVNGGQPRLLVIFDTDEDVILDRAPSGDFKFTPAIFAPRSKVICKDEAHFCDGFVVADEYGVGYSSTGTNLQLHGAWNGDLDIPC